MRTETALREFLEFVLGNLATHPEEVEIGYEFSEGRHVFRVRVEEEDIGRVIGKNGYTVSSIRSLMVAAAERDGATAVLKVLGEG